MKPTSPLDSPRFASVAVFLFATLLASSPQPEVSAQAAVQGATHSGIITVVFGDPPPNSSQPAKIVFSLETARESVELLISDRVLEAAGGIAALVGARVEVTAEPPATADALSLSRPLIAQRIVRLFPDAAGQELVSGAHPWVTVLCNFSDSAADTPKSVAYYQSMMANSNPGLDHYWRELSYGVANIDGSTVVGPFVLPNPRSFYHNPTTGAANLNELANDCAQAGDATVFYPTYDGVNFVFNQNLDCCAWGGGRTMTLDGTRRLWRTTWMPRWANYMSVFSHEMGHGFGLPHSSGPYGAVYDSRWDPMSRGETSHLTFGAVAPHTISYHKDILGWIPPAVKYSVTPGTSQTIEIERIALSPATPGNYLMAHIPTTGSQFYTVEARRFAGYDTRLPGEAVVIHHVVPGRSSPAWVVDPDNNGNVNDAGAMWTPGETFTDATNGITVTVNAMNASSFNVTIVKAGTAPPGISTQPQSQTIASGQTATMSVVATGAQPFTYQWYAGASGNTTSPIGGATSSSYTTPPLTNAASFWVRVSNTGGPVNSNTATISIGVGPSVTAHPSSLTRKAGASAAFTAAANGSPAPAVRWQRGATSSGPWIDVAGATTTTLTFAATAADHGKWFRAVFTNGIGQAASNAASLVVRSVSGSDFTGDATTDLTVYRPATGEWFVRNQPSVSFGGPGYVPVAGDYNGDGTTDVAVYQPSSRTWFVRNQLTIQFGDPGDVPVPGDYNGDGTTDLAVYRPSTGAWFVRNQLAVTGFGGVGFQPVVADYNGDGTTDLAVYQPSTGFWYVRNQFAIQFGGPGAVPAPGDYNGDGAADVAFYQPATGFWSVRNQFTRSHGGAGDLGVARDFDGNGTTDVAVYRPATGQWLVSGQATLTFGSGGDVPVPQGVVALAPTNGDYDADNATDLAVYRPSTGQWFVRNQLAVQFGDPSDTPVPADYNGDGRMDVAVYRPSTGQWFVRNQLAVQFGEGADIPMPGDYNGDGLVDVAVYRPSTGQWFVRNQFAVQFGEPGDIPVPGDYDGDGMTDVAVYRPSTGFWYVRNQFAFQYGDAGYVPVPGDYNGDGLTDLAVYATSTGTWYVRGQLAVQFGDSADRPVPGDYNGDGTTDLAIYRPSTGTWHARNQFGIQFGDPTDVPVVRIGEPR
jgi:M6 family metalloprotease-like protein